MKNLLSKKSSSPKAILVILLVASITIISAASSYPLKEAMAFPHASLIIVPDENDPDQANANPIRLTVGHTNEPAFGKLPGIHDGKHYLEVDLSDEATTLPISNATLFADKYYFRDLHSFENAQSLEDADAFELNVPVTAVFGQPGTFYNRQVVDEGIYGYTIRGVINYYDVALVPFEATKFCSIEGEDLTKFDSPPVGWTGSYGCVENIKDIFFPPPPASKKYSDDSYYPPPKYNDNSYGIAYNNEGGYENSREQYQSYDKQNRDREY
jgi:hypothetical protein